MAESLLVEMNRIMADVMGQRQARYKYWQDSKKNMFFYTIEKMQHKGMQRYVSGIYRYYKTKKVWKPMYRAGHAKKKDAIARARKLFEHWSK